jgi:hypothetical protein
MQDSTDQVNLTINHNPATVETEAESLLSEKSKTDADEREKSQESEKENATLNVDPESAETLLEVERKSSEYTMPLARRNFRGNLVLI